MNFHTAVVAIATTAAATAQCPFTTATLTHTNSGCTAGNMALTGSFDPIACAMSTSPVPLGSTGSWPPGSSTWLFALGLQPAVVPLPQLGPGCTLLVQPDILLATTSGSLVIAAPPTAAPFMFEVQAALIETWVWPFPATSITLSERLTTSLHTAQ